SLDTTTTDTTKDLFIRRARILLGYKFGDKLSVFTDTDSPNLGKGNADGTKNNVNLFIQDFVVTYSFAKEFQLDGGMLLPPSSRNHTQSAASLMAIDYGAYTFNESAALTAVTGRDYGVEARGY